MQTSTPSLIARDHTLFGVCEALGEDFGFNPLYLRVPLAVGLLWNPIAIVAAYAAAGVLVFLTRWISPNPRPVAAEQRAAAGPAPSTAANEVDADLAVAA